MILFLINPRIFFDDFPIGDCQKKKILRGEGAGFPLQKEESIKV